MKAHRRFISLNYKVINGSCSEVVDLPSGNKFFFISNSGAKSQKI